MTDDDLIDSKSSTPSPRRKGPKKSADQPKRIDLIAELCLPAKAEAPPPEPPAKEKAADKKPEEKKPAEKKPAEEKNPELGGRRWAGNGPLPGSRAGDLLIVVGLLLAGVAGLALSTRAGENLPPQFRPVGWWAAGGVGGVALLGLVVRLVRGRWIDVVSHEHGLVYTARGRTRTVRWAEVVSVTEKRVAVLDRDGRPDGHRHHIHILCRDGTEHRLQVGGIAGADKLSEFVHAGTLPHLMPRVVERVTAGRPVAFGRLTVAPDGLIHGRRMLAWGELGEIDIVNGVLVVGRKGQEDPWYAEDCGATPNLQVLLNLIRTRFLTPDPNYQPGRNRAADESRYSVLDKYMPSLGAQRRY